MSTIAGISLHYFHLSREDISFALQIGIPASYYSDVAPKDNPAVFLANPKNAVEKMQVLIPCVRTPGKSCAMISEGFWKPFVHAAAISGRGHGAFARRLEGCGRGPIHFIFTAASSGSEGWWNS